MTVLIYIDTSKQVGDADHLKVLRTLPPRKHGSRKMTPKAQRSSMRSWSEWRLLKESIVQPFRSQSARTLRARTGVENSPE